MGCWLRDAAVLSCVVLTVPVSRAQPAPRRPRGIYAVVNIDENVKKAQAATPPAAPKDYLISVYKAVLANPAVSGLAIWVDWDALNPNPPGSANAYDWSWLDDAFQQVDQWNTQNQTPKTVQLVPLPGFHTPPWVLSQIPSCDSLFKTPAQTPQSNCGQATFWNFTEGPQDVPRALPMPWDPVYKSAWRTFLIALAARYQANPAFVSISVAGPTASSEEMILPINANTPRQDNGYLPNEMWLKLLVFHYPGDTAYQKSDQAFINEWNKAIDMYGEIFSGVTLVATTGNGLPDLSATGFAPPPAAFAADCPTPDMDCAAETTILAYFVKPTVGGANAKAVQEDGMKAAGRGGHFDLGVSGIKLVSQSTAQLTAPTAQILGGLQFAKSFANFTLEEGCTSKFPPDASDLPAGCSIPYCNTTQGCIPAACIPQACLAPGVTQADLASFSVLSQVPGKDLLSKEQAAYNVLGWYFDGTPVASSFGGTPGTVPLNYLQIYDADFLYAAAQANTPATVVRPDGTTFSTTAQDLLNLASQALSLIGEPALLPAITSGGIVPGTIQPGEWLSIYGTNLASGIATWNGDFPTSLAGASVTINGKAAYLSYASPGQLNVQAPDDTATGAVPLVVTTASGSVKSTVTLAQFGPSFFLLDGKHVAAIILRPDGSGAHGGGSYDILGPTGNSLGYPTVAAKAGDTVLLFGSGFGPTNPAVPAGQAFSGAAPTVNPLTLRINNVSITPAFAGLSGPGLYQLNVTVPSGLGAGDVPLQATVGGVQTPSGALISLQ